MDWTAEAQLLGELTSNDLERLFKEHSGCTETQGLHPKVFILYLHLEYTDKSQKLRLERELSVPQLSNSSDRGSDGPFWPPWALRMQVVHRYICRQTIHRLKVIYNVQK